MLNEIIAQYSDKAVDEVVLLYTLSKSSISQQVQTLSLLPASIDASEAP